MLLKKDLQQFPNKTNAASSVRDLLSRPQLFFNDLLSQDFENSISFLQHFELKVHVRDIFVQR